MALIKPLGFVNRRTDNIFKMTHRYLTGPWTHARELPGIGEYGATAWEIFCQGIFHDEPPKDHALVLYYKWFKQRTQPQLS
jgi:hypothetical protein